MRVPRAKRILFFRAVAALLFASGLLLGAPHIFAGQSSQDVSFSVQGKISELSPGKITVDSGNNMNFEVRYDSNTDIQHSDGTPAKASELQIGLEIRAEGALAESGDVFARKIILKPGSKDPSN